MGAERLQDGKLQTTKRLKLVKEARPLLANIMTKLDDHKKWLKEKENTITTTSSSVAPSSSDDSSASSSDGSSDGEHGAAADGAPGGGRRSPEDAKKMKNETEKLLSELSDRLSDSGGLLEAKNKFEEKTCEYEKLVKEDLMNKLLQHQQPPPLVAHHGGGMRIDGVRITPE